MGKPVDVKMALDINGGQFIMTDIKYGTYLGFPIKKFEKKKNGDAYITIIVNEKEFETITDAKAWLKERQMEYMNKAWSEGKVSIIPMCWCGDDGVAQPFEFVESNQMKCPRCKTVISIQAMQFDEMLEVSDHGKNHLELM